MSLEEALAKSTAATVAMTAALTANTEQLKVIEAGRADALAALTEKSGATATSTGTRGRKKAEPVAEPATTVETAASAVPSAEQFKADAGAWLAKDDEGRADRVAKLKSLLANFGATQISDVSDDDRTAAAYFVKRWDAGLDVDFNADYNFDAPLEAATEDDAGDDLLG